MSINSVILYFIRSGMGKVKRLTLICEYEDGSLKMPHPESLIKSQRIVCLQRYLGLLLKFHGKSSFPINI